MKNILFSLAAIALTACSQVEVPACYEVVPQPQVITLTEAAPFKLNRRCVIAYQNDTAGLMSRNAEFLAEYINQSTGHTLTLKQLKGTEQSASHAITLTLDASIPNDEGYRLTTDAQGVRLCARTPRGIFYGIQTLRKSMPASAQGATILLPSGQVEDQPRFAYRGMHLDVCRHFFPLSFVKKYIDLLALHNMNTLHWHLTDDQGWRLEIKKYPRLTEVGSQRSRTVIGRNSGEYDETPHGGFYTQEEAREIVRYAQERHITVIPEVEMPGHALAALAAYPEFGCTGGPYEVCPLWGVFDDVFCIGNDQAMQFLEDVLAEVIDIFPSRYIHIGGDEAPRTRWQHCPQCQARIRAEKLKADAKHSAEDRLQSYCMTRIERFLNERGRQIIGWDEILEGDVAPNATVMSWRGSAGGIQAAQMGHDVIMTPNDYCYFDYYQTKERDNEPLAIGGYVPLEKVYSLEPTAQLTAEQARHIVGAQANLWTEYIATPEHVEYMVLPRMAALCEVQWSAPEKKSYDDFRNRLTRLVDIYQRDSLNYSVSGLNE
ncbi:MAG: beta-N-acetylhexosaminidase [Bacteroides sp.]